MKTINIGVNLPEPVHEAFTKCFQRNHDLLAWLAREIVDVNPIITCHTLALREEKSYVSQLDKSYHQEKLKPRGRPWMNFLKEN